jgi:hypothetical protein
MHVLLAALSLFPLVPGHHWTFRDVQSGAKNDVTVGARRVLTGFPGAGALRVRTSGKTVQAWDTHDRRWEAWFRFGLRARSRYKVALAQTSFWQGVEVTVDSKTASARDYRGKRYANCTRFVFRQLNGLVDAGMNGIVFCPDVGPVRYAEDSIAGPRTYALALALYKKK